MYLNCCYKSYLSVCHTEYVRFSQGKGHAVSIKLYIIISNKMLNDRKFAFYYLDKEFLLGLQKSE